ncbi:divalent-cation tolerance protein CutA [Haloferula rosea]|uniref:Divalent-cation tolerance protein CutA n=1 Tax=Haloferula rosea TaxID=490093 RepID=A0A934RCK5_9BACT|nr:divalent-cation tolerance protein CutA [Haloferula rosea]MBK1827248.1 divalent-cation tolerance protein CutA [Haloferula rosea]
MKNEVLVVLCSFPSEKEARQIGAALVEKQAAACVNVIPGATSIYRWEGKIHEDSEALGVIKTTRAAYDRLEAMILELHPYEVPEVIALPVGAGSEGYLGWVRGQTELPGTD